MMNFPIIGIGKGRLDSSNEVLEVRYEKIIDSTHEEYKYYIDVEHKSDDSKYLAIKTILQEDCAIQNIEEAYLKLHLLSMKKFLPNTLNLDGLFKSLKTVAWTSKGPFKPSEIPEKWSEGGIDVYSVDKFPRLTNYLIPEGIRIADTSRVRLGAYLSEGTTIMHEGFVNFNAGTLGPAMIEGRISAGVVVGANSDLGGGSSTMGTLSGGNKITISIGENCLLGANAGLGISLGNNCIVEAGLYLTGGSKVEVFDKKMVSKGVKKASELSGKDNILYIRNSLTGKIEARINSSKLKLNPSLHQNE